MKSRLILTAVLAVGFSSAVCAQPYYPQSRAPFGFTQQAQQPGPSVILRQGLKKLLAFVSEAQPSRAQAEVFLEREIAPYFDFAYMARWAVGERVWQQMGDSRRMDAENYIKRDFLTTLASRLTGFGGQQVRVMRPRSQSLNEAVVAVSVLNPQTYPARLEFRFYRAEAGWKVFDVSANGSSAVVHYRNQFRRMMRQRTMQPQGRWR